MKVEMFSGPQCNYCDRAKALLKARNIDYIELDIAADPDNNDELLSRLPGVRALPQLFVDGLHIGSFEDLELWIEQGKLV